MVNGGANHGYQIGTGCVLEGSRYPLAVVPYKKPGAKVIAETFG
jgi:hypothetical protein